MLVIVVMMLMMTTTMFVDAMNDTHERRNHSLLNAYLLGLSGVANQRVLPIFWEMLCLVLGSSAVSSLCSVQFV